MQSLLLKVMSYPRSFLFLILLFSVQFVLAQLNDNFSDGDFSSNPAWVGDGSLFTVNPAQELQSDGPSGTARIYLSTPNNQMDETEWRIYTRFPNAPSNSNFIKIYLTANRPELDSALQGYFLRIGESGSNDGIDLYRQDSLDEVMLMDGPPATVSSGWDMVVRVNRDANGNWDIKADLSNNGNFLPQGQASDNTYPTTSHFGFWIAHTSSRRDQFFFDDVYIGPPIVDTTAAVIDTVIVLSQNELQVNFSEVVEKSSSEKLSNYEVMPSLGAPNAAVRSITDSSQVVLAFAGLFQRGTTYRLNATNIEDRNGNVGGSTAGQFDYNIPEEAVFEDVIINEIFPDPTPSVGLPGAEYLELHNRSTKLLDLTNWTFSNGSTVGTLPPYLLQPGTYVIVTASSAAGDFTIFGDVISPSSWPSLVNSRDNLGLRSANGTLIDTVDYAISWYKDESKDNGGWSLERINPTSNNCPDITNWSASNDASGGTPGRRNSIFSTATDPIPPTSISVSVIAEDSLLVCFNESMDATLIADPSVYELLDEGTPITATAIGPEFRCAKLFFSDPFEEGNSYSLTVTNVADCAGNLIAAPLSAQFVLGRPATAFEVVINELMPDPSPTVGLPDVEFIEIHNRTQEILAIDNWGIQSANSIGRWGNISLEAGAYAIICSPGDSALLGRFGQVIAVSGLPSLTNSGDDVKLINEVDEEMDYVYYENLWYRDLLFADGGYSLERINPNFVDCNTEGNWIASRDPSGGTPGRQNSWFDPNGRDQSPPKIESVLVPDALTLVLEFGEQINQDYMSNTAIYSISPTIGEPDLAFPNPPLYRSIELLLPQPLDSQTVYTLRIEGAQDCAGNATNIQGRFGIPQTAQAGDILINEILFNTFTGGKDFVEIYNASEKVINLSELFIGRAFPGTDSIFDASRIATGNQFILPGHFLCLTESPALQRELYMPPDTANFLTVDDMPSFPDREGVCIIFRNDSLQLDKFSYQNSFHFPTLADDDGVSLERISLERPTEDETNWHSASSTVGFASPGYPNSQAEELSPDDGAVTLERQTVSPDGDGFEDNLPINYEFDFTGGNARVSIMDAQGRLIRTLKQNTLLGTEPGTFFWDGRDDDNTRADVGIYVVLFEVTRQDTGERLVYKRACVVAKRLN
jgi:hypothetical protein